MPPHGGSTGQASFGLGPAGTLLHAPTALQVPQAPQASLGSVLAVTGRHWPSAPGAAHVKQPPVQSEAQQTPSTHMPLAHWRSLPHSWPLARSGAHSPPVGLVAQ